MDRGVGAAARLLPGSDRKDLAIQALAGSETVSDLAARHGVSRKFVYQQTRKGCRRGMCWKRAVAVSGAMTVSRQAARSIMLLASG